MILQRPADIVDPEIEALLDDFGWTLSDQAPDGAATHCHRMQDAQPITLIVGDVQHCQDEVDRRPEGSPVLLRLPCGVAHDGLKIRPAARIHLLAGRDVFRLSANGAMWRLSRDATAPRHLLAADHKVLAAARHMVRRASSARSPDHGRAAQSAWIASVISRQSGEVEIVEKGPYTTEIVPRAGFAATLHYIHGGGLVYYRARDFVPLLSLVAQDAGCRIMLHSYEQCPERSIADVVPPLLARLNVALESSGGDLLMGDSVGGLLALYAAQRRRVKALLLLYPVLSLDVIYPSYGRFGNGLLLDDTTMLWFRDLWGGWFQRTLGDPFGMPLPHCPIKIFAATNDILADDAASFVRKNPRVAINWLAGQPHDTLLYAGRVASARQAVESVVACIKSITGE